MLLVGWPGLRSGTVDSAPSRPRMSLLDALLTLIPLDRMPRTGWIQAGIPHPESVAAHSLGCCQIALALAPRVTPPLDVDRVVSLAAVHDLPEALLSDLPRTAARLLPEGAKREAEERAAVEVLGPLSPEALERHAEYQAQETREARLAKLCDRLHLGLRTLAYVRSGRRGLEEFVGTLRELDATEFEPCELLQHELLEALAAEAARDA